MSKSEEKTSNSAASAGKRELTKAQNRDAIIKAAREVFGEMGYGEATVRDIIRRTGLASGTFYNYFKSKEEIFQALMDDRALMVRPKLRQVRIEAHNFEEFIRETFHTYFDYVASNRDTAQVIRRNAGAIRVRMDTPEIIAGFDELEEDIANAVRDGVLPNVDVGFLTASFVGVAFEIGDRMLVRESVDADSATDFATALFLGGVKNLPELKT